MKWCIALLLFLAGPMLWAQNTGKARNEYRALGYDGEKIGFGGSVSQNERNEDFAPLSGTTVAVICGDGHQVTVSHLATDSTGYYELELEYDRLYNLMFSYPGHYTKILEINTFNIPTEDREGGFFMLCDIRLQLSTNRRKHRLMEREAIGKCAYDSATHSMEWDITYIEKFNRRIERSHWWWPW